MTDLTERTRQHVRTLFVRADVEAVERILEQSCGQNLPGLAGTTPEGLERIRFAALRLSEGRLGALREAVELAALDWRDLLMAAGFGEDVAAHAKWQPHAAKPSSRKPLTNAEREMLWAEGWNDLADAVAQLGDGYLVDEGWRELTLDECQGLIQDTAYASGQRVQFRSTFHKGKRSVQVYFV